ncbi:MAG: glycosyltransferase family 4 protein [Leptolyngbyaceae cyanobacterium SL_5_9]|nr:glycosyltransferase family 4 protein [Leptolyngbyaceae cyanobacterium SL_5_9]
MYHPNAAPIGYLLKTFPNISEAHVLNEILELERQGLKIHIFSLRRPQDEKVYPAIAEIQSPVTYIPSLLPTFSSNAAVELLQPQNILLDQSPRRYWQTSAFQRSRPEVKALNDLLQAGYLALELQKLGITHLHACSADVPAAVAELVQSLIGISYSFAAHVRDIHSIEPEVFDRRMDKAEFVLACTRHSQQFLQGISAHHSSVYLSHPGVDLSRFLAEGKPATNGTSRVPLLLSVIHSFEEDGLTDLLQACQLLKRKRYAFHCKVVSYGSVQFEISPLIQALHLEDVVSLVSNPTQDELVDLYQQADVFVLPCRTAKDGDCSDIPQALLEAMAMKLPVITTNTPEVEELIEHMRNGLLVLQQAPLLIAAEIEYLLVQPDLMQELGYAAREQVKQRFSLAHNAQQIKDLLLSAVSCTPAKVTSSQTVKVTV